jgi:hypothetical protein
MGHEINGAILKDTYIYSIIEVQHESVSLSGK